MNPLSLAPEIADKKVRQRAVKRLRELNVTLPTLTDRKFNPAALPPRRARVEINGVRLG